MVALDIGCVADLRRGLLGPSSTPVRRVYPSRRLARSSLSDGPRSNGPPEGHVNRLKTIDWRMYGRAGFVLPRARVLNAVHGECAARGRTRIPGGL